jgi:ADP-heptose:LPS heptosyltransferase
MPATERILFIQTAFIGDVVLATGIIEKWHACFPDACIDVLVRKGNESLFKDHPFLNNVWVWNKQTGKLKNLLKLLPVIRQQRYDKVFNVQRFAATGLLTAFSGGEEKIGFDKNPFSFLFTTKVPHIIGTASNPLHEIERNHALIAYATGHEVGYPKLHPSVSDESFIARYQQQPYICIAPASVWFTKQFPVQQWVNFIEEVPPNYKVFLIGGASDKLLCNTILQKLKTSGNAQSLCGELSFLASAALMKGAVMNYVNDSAPMHFASAMNAPVTAIYCSTLPSFGFGPLSELAFIIEVKEKLSCRPCGLHGKKTCPEGHFNCANKISTTQLLEILNAVKA